MYNSIHSLMLDFYIKNNKIMEVSRMRKYYIPPTIKEKEKIIGGILTLGQFAFLITGLVIGIVLAVFIFVITDSIEMAISNRFIIRCTICFL